MNQRRDNADAAERRPRRVKRWLIAVVLLVVLIPVTILAIAVARFDPNRYAPAVIAAVEKSTGRQLSLAGPISLHLSLTPVIEASGIQISNPGGFADPSLMTLGRVEVKIALFPLLSHRLDILKLVLVNPNIVLESNKAGAADWDFSAPSQAAPAEPSPQASELNPQTVFKIALEAVEIENGLLTIKGAGKVAPISISLPSLTGTASSLAAPLHLTANAVLGKTPIGVAGVVGPVERFSGLGEGPWPIDLTLKMGGATGTVQGLVSHPRTGKGYDLTVNIAIPALETLAASLPPIILGHASLPPIHDMQISARIMDQNSTVPAIDNLSIKAGTSDLSSLRPGLMLTTLDIEMAALDQFLSVNASGKAGDMPLTLSGNFGPPQALLNPVLLPSTMPPQGSYPLTLNAQAGNAQIGISGAVATPQTLSGVALALSATIPDLSALSPLAAAPLPAWKNITAKTTLTDPGGQGLRNAAGLDGLAVTMDNAAFGGAISLYFGAQPRLQAAVKFAQLDIDALRAAMSPPASPPVAPPSGAGGAGTAAPAQLPMKLLKAASADVQISADTLIWNQATYTALQAHGVLANGILTLNPVTGQLPGGSVSANATLNATSEPATETLKVNAPALALAPFLEAFGLPDTAQGTVQAQLSAGATGDDLHAMASSLNGQLGLATVNGVVDGRLMSRLFGNVLGVVGLPANLVGAQGPVAVRCAALRVDATNGIGTIKALTLDSSRLLVQGGGTVDLGNDQLSIILRPQVQVAGTNVGVPVEVGGSFEAPTTSVAPLGAFQEAAKSAVGLPVGLAQTVLGNNSILGRAANMLGIGNGGDVCPVALNLGRLGQPGPAASPMAAAPTASSIVAPALSGPKNLLDSLFSK